MSGVIQRCQLIAKSSLRRCRRILADAAALLSSRHGVDRADKYCFVRIVSSNRSTQFTMLATLIIIQLMFVRLGTSAAEAPYAGK